MAMMATKTEQRAAIWGGRTVAASDQAKDVGGYPYFPRDSVNMDLLRLSPKTESDLACPHGVQFYDLVDGKTVSERAVWSYEKPKASMMSVDHWIGFWDLDVE